MNRNEYSTSFIVLQDDRDGMIHCRGTMSPERFCLLCPKELGLSNLLKILVRLPGPGIWVQVWGEVLERIEGDYHIRLSGIFTDLANLDVCKLATWTIQAREAA